MGINIEKLLKDIATEYGTTPEKVREDLESLIDTCWEMPDPEIHAKWVAMSLTGQRPTIEEVIVYLSLCVQEMQLEEQENDCRMWPFIAQ